MNDDDFMNHSVQLIYNDDDRYIPAAYFFIRRAVNFTLKKKMRQGSADTPHVTTKELVVGIKNFTLREFGPMSLYVLNKMGIHKTEDFGNIVFNLIEYKIFGANDNDKLEDFKDVYTFEDAFAKPFVIKNKVDLNFPQLD